MLQKTRRIVLAATLSTEINAIAMSGFTQQQQVTQYVLIAIILLGLSAFATNWLITYLCIDDGCDYAVQRWVDRSNCLYASLGLGVLIATLF